MTQTFLDDPIETFPLGVAKIQVQDGHWTFNNKRLKNCKFPVQQMVETFIRTCAFRQEIQARPHRPRSYSVIATRETVMAHSHLKDHNYRFPSRESINYFLEIEKLPEFIPKYKN